MTAALERASRRLEKDSSEARKFIANRLTDCARSGNKSLAALTATAEAAVDEINTGKKPGESWRRRPLKFVSKLAR
jgi:hypothetical protein